MQADTFDPFLYSAAVKANPGGYVHISSIVAEVMALRKIRHAATVKALHEAFQAPAKLAKAAGDTELLAMLTEAAKTRKEALTAK